MNWDVWAARRVMIETWIIWYERQCFITRFEIVSRSISRPEIATDLYLLLQTSSAEPGACSVRHDFAQLYSVARPTFATKNYTIFWIGTTLNRHCLKWPYVIAIMTQLFCLFWMLNCYDFSDIFPFEFRNNSRFESNIYLLIANHDMLCVSHRILLERERRWNSFRKFCNQNFPHTAKAGPGNTTSELTSRRRRHYRRWSELPAS